MRFLQRVKHTRSKIKIFTGVADEDPRSRAERTGLFDNTTCTVQSFSELGEEARSICVLYLDARSSLIEQNGLLPV